MKVIGLGCNPFIFHARQHSRLALKALNTDGLLLALILKDNPFLPRKIF